MFTSYDKIALAKVIAEIWEHDNFASTNMARKHKQSDNQRGSKQAKSWAPLGNTLFW